MTRGIFVFHTCKVELETPKPMFSGIYLNIVTAYYQVFCESKDKTKYSIIHYDIPKLVPTFVVQGLNRIFADAV